MNKFYSFLQQNNFWNQSNSFKNYSKFIIAFTCTLTIWWFWWLQNWFLPISVLTWHDNHYLFILIATNRQIISLNFIFMHWLWFFFHWKIFTLSGRAGADGIPGKDGRDGTPGNIAIFFRNTWIVTKRVLRMVWSWACGHNLSFLILFMIVWLVFQVQMEKMASMEKTVSENDVYIVYTWCYHHPRIAK